MEFAFPTITIEFDFTSPEQQELLSQLQQQGYGLLVFQEVNGMPPGRQPIWLSQSFNDIFGVFTLSYTPQFKMFVSQAPVLAAENAAVTLEKVSASSIMTDLLPLGTSLAFNQNGSFTPSDQEAPPQGFLLQNNTASHTKPVTVGLAASLDNGPYAPICAVWMPPQGRTIMVPTNTLQVGIAKLDSAAGAVALSAFAPGAAFRLFPSQRTVKLAIEPSTYAVVSAGTVPVQAIPAQDMSMLATGGY